MGAIKFISYDGAFPNLCAGVLTLEINGERVSLPEHSLESGGSVDFDENGDDVVEHGDWFVKLPPDLEQYRDEITRIVNENVPHGCCGGCL